MRKFLLTTTMLATFAATSVMAQRMDDVTTHNPYIQAVDEFVPAPGQFVNALPAATEDDTPETMAQKCTELLTDIEQGLISLGAFGGYVTFHFDHSVANISGQRDIYIAGNASQSNSSTLKGGSSEPGIVMVSKDVNGNGLPDDPWYELSGSADVDSVGKVVYGYEVTYTKASLQNVPWTDNRGGTGEVERNTFHRQEYFPLWLGDELTLKGTLLPPNAVDTNGKGNNWVQVFFREGYVDNKPNTDEEACSFDFDWAVEPLTRKPVKVDFVDFVRVYNATQQMCGWLGESSTEIAGAKDLHTEASIDAIKDAIVGIDFAPNLQPVAPEAFYDLQGRPVDLQSAPAGIYVKRSAEGTRKIVH